MSELISREEAKLAWANGEDIQFCYKQHEEENTWFLLLSTDPLSTFDRDDFLFRLKPRTISLNNIEVPAPFEPNEFEDCYMLSDLYEHGYTKTSWKYSKSVPAWRTEDEIKQVVSALRSVFKGEAK